MEKWGERGRETTTFLYPQKWAKRKKPRKQTLVNYYFYVCTKRPSRCRARRGGGSVIDFVRGVIKNGGVGVLSKIHFFTE